MSGDPDTFITLTCQPANYATKDEAAQALVLAWKLIRRRAKAEHKRDPKKRPFPTGPKPRNGWRTNSDGTVPRQVTLRGDDLPFIAVFEKTRHGWPHLHILCRSQWIDQKWLSLQMEEITGAPIVDIKRVYEKHRVVYYIVKYISKCPQAFGGCKRYWRHLQWGLDDLSPEEKKERKSGWEKVAMTAWHYAQELASTGDFYIVPDKVGFLLVSTARQREPP